MSLKPEVWKHDAVQDNPWIMECCGGDGPPWCCVHFAFATHAEAISAAQDHYEWDHQERKLREAATE